MKISIITIVYNNVQNILDCINSVKSQSYSNIEHIIIDGGSIDGTVEVIEKNLQKVSIYISEKDNGLYNALNKGIKLATGDIIGILHSDDLYYNSNTISEIAKVFLASKADLVYSKGQYVEKTNIEKIRRIYPSKPFKEKYLRFGWIPLHTTIYVKKEVFEKYGLYDERYKIASDYEISLRWFTNNSINKYYLDKWVVKMRLGGKSTTAKLQKKKSIEDYQIIKQFHLWGYITLFMKIIRKVPQYLIPLLIKMK